MEKTNLNFRHGPKEFQTQGILSRVSRACRESVGRLSTLLFLILLGLGFSGQAWADNSYRSNSVQTDLDTSYIVTANLSTKDTIYVKHEDATIADTSWWAQNRDIIGGIIQALLALLAGAAVSWCTSKMNAKQERKKMEQESRFRRENRIMEYGIEREREIYQKIVAIQAVLNLEGSNVSGLVDELKNLILVNKPDMQKQSFQAANDIYTYFTMVMSGTMPRSTVEEKNLLDKYCAAYRAV